MNDKKVLKPMPELIAYSKDLTIIPYENVIACSEDSNVAGQLLISVKGTDPLIYLEPDDAPGFIDGFNKYLTMYEIAALDGEQHDTESP